MEPRQLIYGRHPILEALKAGKNFEKILLQKELRSPELNEIRDLARAENVPLQYVPVQKINSVTRKNHQGVVGFLSLIQYYNIEDVMLQAYDEGRIPLFLLLDNITDVRNFGAIARSAELAGVDALVVPRRGGALISADAIKASAGALNHVHVCKVTELRDALNYFKLNGIKTAAADETAEKDLWDTDLSMPAAIILGAEGEGINPVLQEKADIKFKIPMAGKIGSFNVSVAAGIVLYEVMRQRKN